MANKTLIIKMDPSATFTGGSTASSGIATYSNKIITGIEAGNTNLTLNFASSKISSRTFNKVFNIKVKSQLQTLQDEYNAAVAALTDIQNWFKSNTVKVTGETSDTLTFTYTNIPTTWNSAVSNDYTTLITSKEAYFTEHGDPTYDYTTETLRLYFVYENNRYRLKKLFNYYAENRYGGSKIYNDRETNVTSYTISPSLTPVETLINNLNTNGVRELSAIAKDILAAI